MESLVDSQHGTATLLASLVVVLALQLIFKIGEFVWKLINKDTEKSVKALEQLTVSVQRLEITFKEAEKHIIEIPKFKQDLRRYYAGLKYLAGEKWPHVRDEIMSDDIPS